MTIWVEREVKAEVDRIARQEGLSVSATGAAFLREAVRQKLHVQHAVLLQPIIEQAIRRQMGTLSTRLAWLLVRVAFDAGQTRSLVTNILGRQAGVSPDVLKTILAGSGKSVKANITRRTPQMAELIEAVEQWMVADEGAPDMRMAIVKASFTRSRAGAKASVRYMSHRPGKDGQRLTRELVGYDGTMKLIQAYEMIDEAGQGSLFYRLVISPDPRTEDAERDLHLREIIEKTMLHLEDRFQKAVPLRDDLLIDRRSRAGQQHSHQVLIADYNNDGVKDIFISDHGGWWRTGYRDSYLSQPNGTWLESSATHFQTPNFVNFDHGAATGDIDGDGDFDIVLADLNPGIERDECPIWHECFFFCRRNDGFGYMTLEPCGGVWQGALELADMDNDGDLDAIVGGNEVEGRPDNLVTPTGIVLNDGTGFFAAGPFPDHDLVVPLPRRPGFFAVTPEASASDLDADGDLDIVFSRTGINYAGTALQIIENTGELQFRDRGLIVFARPPADWPGLELPDDARHEGHEWNAHVHAVRFSDFDRDGLIDIYTIANQERHYGVVLMNQGSWRFRRIDPHEVSNPIRILRNRLLN